MVRIFSFVVSSRLSKLNQSVIAELIKAKDGSWPGPDGHGDRRGREGGSLQVYAQICKVMFGYCAFLSEIGFIVVLAQS